jgi:hypothetical protein
MTMYNLVPPEPSLNGNSKDSLIRECRSILDALRDLEEIISKSSDLWHGRNFLPQGSEKGREKQVRAQKAWEDRRMWLHDFNNELTNIAIKVQSSDKVI